MVKKISGLDDSRGARHRGKVEMFQGHDGLRGVEEMRLRYYPAPKVRYMLVFYDGNTIQYTITINK